MAVGITSRGNLALSSLRHRLMAIRGGEFRLQLSQVLAAAALKLVMDTFRRQESPYGKAWQPLQYRRGQALLDTGRLRGSVATVPLLNGFRVDATAEYAKYHQYGTRAHARAGRTAKQGARGRFVAAKKAGTLLRIRPHANTGIPQRQFIPMPETGGLPDSWRKVFDRETNALITRQVKGAV